MAKILIPTKPDDADTIYVKLALESKGHECIVWYTADFPGQQKHSFELIEKHILWHAKGVDFEICPDHQFDTVWYRRPRKPCLPDTLHADDIENATNENMEFFKSFWRIVAPNAFWANSISGVNAANCKLLQLKIAMNLGLKVPDSLFSNDPVRIRQFINRYKHQGVIFKTLQPVIWKDQNEIRMTYTDEIRIEDLPPDSILQLTPGIFQNKIRKKFELRITYFGPYSVAVKISSQEHERGKLDWRYIPANQLKIEPFVLPAEIDEKCRLLMKKLGLVMGCFDFIITPEYEYIFLEINEQGQFLWIEELNPDIKMLDPFAEFLIHGSTGFRWKGSEKSIPMANYKKQMTDIVSSALSKHIKPEM